MEERDEQQEEERRTVGEREEMETWDPELLLKTTEGGAGAER